MARGTGQGLGPLALSALMALGCVTGDATPTPERARRDSVTAAQATHQRDSVALAAMQARVHALSWPDSVRYDQLAHASARGIVDSALHRRVMTARLEFATRALGGEGYATPDPTGAQMQLDAMYEPLTPAQAARRAEIRSTATRRAARALQTEQVRARRAFAARYESQLLDQNIDADVRVLGAEATTLRVKWILVSRVLVHKFEQDAATLDQLRALGFKKFVLTDGYDGTWSFTL